MCYKHYIFEKQGDYLTKLSLRVLTHSQPQQELFHLSQGTYCSTEGDNRICLKKC